MASRRFLGGLILSLALSSSFAAEPPTTAIIGTPRNRMESAERPAKKYSRTTRKRLGRDGEHPEEKMAWHCRTLPEHEAGRATTDAGPDARMGRPLTDGALKVRDTYKDFKQLPPEQKQVVRQKWEAYSNLPAAEKQRIRETGKSSKLLATPPASAPLSSSAAPHATDRIPQPEQEHHQPNPRWLVEALNNGNFIPGYSARLVCMLYEDSSSSRYC